MKQASILALLLALSGRAHAQVTVVGNGVEERAAQRGESYSGALRLRNQGRETAEVRLYLTDYSFQAGGSTRFDAPGSLPRSNAAWIAFAPAQLRIPAGGEATVGYTVTVPGNVERSGTFWSMLMVEGVAPGSALSTSAAGQARVRVGIQPALRYGVQIATTLPGAAPALAFANAHAYAGPQGKVLELDLANNGEVAFRPELRVELFDEAGHRVASLSSRRGLLYPGTSLRQSFELGAIATGTYQALVVADAGGDRVFGAQYRLRL